MRTLTLGVPWSGGVRLSAKAVVIGAVALASGTAQVAQAGINVWTSHGPYGGRVQALAIDPTTPSTLYAGTDGWGVFQSTNSGGSWSPVNTGLSGYALYVEALAIDRTTPSTLYAGTDGGVFSIQQVSVCVGDCKGNGQVTVDEILTLVNVALNAQLSDCSASDANDDGQITIDEILTAVNNALNGCGGG